MQLLVAAFFYSLQFGLVFAIAFVLILWHSPFLHSVHIRKSLWPGKSPSQRYLWWITPEPWYVKNRLSKQKPSELCWWYFQRCTHKLVVVRDHSLRSPSGPQSSLPFMWTSGDFCVTKFVKLDIAEFRGFWWNKTNFIPVVLLVVATKTCWIIPFPSHPDHEAACLLCGHLGISTQIGLLIHIGLASCYLFCCRDCSAHCNIYGQFVVCPFSTATNSFF